MKRIVMILAAAIVLVPVSLWAADAPKAEVFGGFSLLSFGGGGSRTTASGWQGAISGNVNEKFSIVGDFGGHYKDGGSALEYLGGPRYTHRLDKAAVFAHALYGGTHFSDGGGNHFTMAYGGGVDVNAGMNVAIRIVQVDWALIKEAGTWEKNNVRFGFGVVFKMSK
jgi:hypothetical protein